MDGTPSERFVPTHRLQRKLSPFAVLLLTLSCLSPVYSVYGLGSDVLLQVGTGAAALFVASIGVAIVWAVVYAELASAYPYAGGDYVGVGSILGPWAGMASLAIWTATLAPSTAFLAKTVAVYAADLAPGASPTALTLGSLAAALLVALLAVRTSAHVTGVFLAVESLAVLALVAAGLWHPARSLASVLWHPVALGSAAPGTGALLLPAAAGAMALGAVSAAYATCGGNQAIAFGEELVDPQRRMGGVIMWAASIGAFATALPVVAVTLGAGDLPAMLKSPAPISAFFAAAAGTTAGRLLSGCVVLAVFNAMIVQLMFYARLLFSLGRDAIFSRRVNAALAGVHGPSGTPRGATLAAAALSAACCFLKTHVLIVFTSGLVVYTLALVSAAVLVGRRRQLTGQTGCWRAPLYPLAPVLGLALAGVFAVADLVDADAGRPSILILGALVALAVAWQQRVLRHRPGGWTPRLGG